MLFLLYINFYMNNNFEKSGFWVNNSTPALALMIIKNSKIAFKDVKGCARFDDNKKCILEARLNTRFLINSMTKHFIAAIILMLEEENKLSLEDDITKYVELPEKFKGIKIKHLIFHISGIPKFNVNDSELIKEWDTAYEAKKTMGNKDYIKYFKKFKLNKVDSHFKYSDPGYILLAEIIEKVTNQTYSQFFHQRIFDRFAMVNSFINPDKESQENYVFGYDRWPIFKQMRDENIERNIGAGGIWSTLDDYAKWINAFDNNKIFKNKETMEKFLSYGKFDNGKNVLTTGLYNTGVYGFGMVHSQENYKGKKYKLIWHNGLYSGTSSSFIKFLDHNLWIVTFNNCRATHPTCFELLEQAGIDID